MAHSASAVRRRCTGPRSPGARSRVAQAGCGVRRAVGCTLMPVQADDRTVPTESLHAPRQRRLVPSGGGGGIHCARRQTELRAHGSRPVPPWKISEVGEPTVPGQAVVAVAERMYGSAENVPGAVGWLRDEEFAFGEPYGATGEFLWLHERTGSRSSDVGFDSIPAAPRSRPDVHPRTTRHGPAPTGQPLIEQRHSRRSRPPAPGDRGRFAYPGNGQAPARPGTPPSTTRNRHRTNPETTKIPPDLAIGRDLVTIPERTQEQSCGGPVGI